MEGIVKSSFKEINESPEPLLALTDIVFNTIQNKIRSIIPEEYDGNIALLGGIQINTSLDFFDYFMIKEFRIINPKNKIEIDLLSDLQEELNKD